jgi:hypothetical protein
MRKCPKGMVYDKDKDKKVCVPRTPENDDGLSDYLEI